MIEWAIRITLCLLTWLVCTNYQEYKRKNDFKKISQDYQKLYGKNK